MARLPTVVVWLGQFAVVLLAARAVCIYLRLGFAHLRYPFELEWMEGGMVDAVRRVAEGKPLYAAPSLDYVPYIYAPLWFYTAAAVSKIFGPGFFAARLTSLLASLGCIALVFRLVERETRDAFAGVLGAGLYAGCYKLASGFYDLARVDSLSVCLLLGAIYVARFRPSYTGRLVAALLFMLAFLAKQSAAAAFLPVAIYLALADRRTGWWLNVAGTASMAGAFFAVDALHHGWFRYYCFWVPRRHPLVESLWIDFWRTDLLAPLGIALVLGAVYFATGRRGEGRAFYLAATVGMVAMSWMARLKAGGWTNGIMPGFAIIAVLFGLGIAAVRRLGQSLDARAHNGARLFVAVVAAAQFGAVAFEPLAFLPSDADLAAGEALLQRLRGIGGDVYVPAHGNLATLAGKTPFLHEQAAADVFNAGASAPQAELYAAIARAIREQRFAAIVLDGGFFRKEVAESYELNGPVFAADNTFLPVTGFRTRPQELWLPRRRVVPLAEVRP